MCEDLVQEPMLPVESPNITEVTLSDVCGTWDVQKQEKEGVSHNIESNLHYSTAFNSYV